MMNNERGENGQSGSTNAMAQLLSDAMAPGVARVIAGLFKEGKMDFNNELAQKMARKMLTQELDKLPEDARAALEKTRVKLVRQADRIEVVIDTEGDPDVEKVQNVMLDSLLGPISQIVTLFGCRVNVEPAS
jgi:hypothetical protein